MTERNDLEILMAAIEYGRAIGEDVRISSRASRVYFVLGFLMGAVVMALVITL